MDKIAVLIPCFNEEKTIGKVMNITLKKLTKKHIGARICWLRNKLGRK